jgi:diaminohydroxyphosphoribosylaminopyrimidine deaminase/5-amino-6-(5-phosphoribosylamino)uracil reductase
VAAAALRLNLRYLVPKVLGRPLVTLKWAMSLDGRIATRTKDSRWITGERGRRWSLRLREEHDAILVGSGTVLADDPRLDRRLGLARGPILRVVLDRRLRFPDRARMLTVPGPVLVYTASRNEARRRRLTAAGAEVVRLDPVEPATVLTDLARRGVGSLLVEGGGEVAAAWVAAGLYDQVHAAVAPLLVAGREAPGPLGGAGPAALAEAPRLDGLQVRRRGLDVILTAMRQGCLPELSSSVGAS